MTKSYLGTPVLVEVDVEVAAGSLTVISGPSGSGKTTLLNLVAGLDLPDDGEIVVGGTDVVALPAQQRERFRARHGHVFQRSGLLGGLTLRENIESPHLLTGHPTDPGWVRHLVGSLGIADVLDSRAGRVSGGQAQRAALVRCLAHRPDVVFADEPTASLDTASKHLIHALLRDISEQEGTTVLMVSHDEISTGYATAQVHLLDGRIQDGGTP
ncbi:ATP-binding cassette domain-containing protein [Nocardioides sp. QY071]|uniref:ABC transporter ATP-binding protein n=1 Tax=Nocardioides sp. QY071 TaxID=3044187 RepID=UPI00249A27CD|nr:ATP-binding cassette domain-containing protein [Nocardioides sp. QY071]WGY02449.1 ATP-binding cassette domain-containing protein [Nocardioides sp. QY071]